MTNMRRGFTMIELIFVIVIIGILASVAIPKLSATRDDAKASTELNNLATCINDVGTSFTATGTEDNNTAACGALSCATMTIGSNSDGNVTVAVPTTAVILALPYCDNVKTAMVSKEMNGTKQFGGTKVQY